MKRGVSLAFWQNELESKIRQAEQHKNSFIHYLQSLKEKCLKREITYEKYLELSNKKHEGKTSSEWIHYYDEYIKKCNYHIYEEEKKRNRSKYIITAIGILFLSLSIIFLIYYFPSPTGRSIQSADPLYTDALNVSFADSKYYTWTPSKTGNLTAIALSGTLEGTGYAKVYLNNLLIIDTENIQQSSLNTITGNAIEGENISFSNATESNEIILNETINATLPLLPEANLSQSNDSINSSSTKSFSVLCEETCIIPPGSALPSYQLWIEIENASLTLSEVTYTLFPETTSPSESVNETPQNVTPVEENETNLTYTLLQEPAVIGQPVKWKNHIKKEKAGNVSIDIPEEASNVIIKKKENSDFIEVPLEKIKEEKDNKKIAEANKNKTLHIDENSSEYEIEYETSAPQATEMEYSPTYKQITITSPETLHYTNITTFTQINENLKIIDNNKIQLFWIVNGTKQQHPFTAQDKDNNTFIDYIEWITPNLSNQTFEIIIITKAEHLNETRSIVADIYEYVKEKDNLWVEIPENNYVRVTFERNLTSSKDITIYARSNFSNALVTVYEKDNNTPIAEFESISQERYYQVILTNLPSEQDTFDLLVEGGKIEFDHIIDPTLTGGATYNSSDINVTQEFGSAHLTTSSNAPYNSLIAYWNFDKDNATNAYDLSPTNLNATYKLGATVNTSCNSGYNDCAEFYGTGEHIFHSHTTALEPQNITVMAWIKPYHIVQSGDSRRWVISKGDKEWSDGHYAILISNDLAGNGAADSYINIGGGGANAYRATGSKNTSKVGQWSHIAITYNSTTLVLYVNGVFNASTNINKNRTTSSTESFNIGRRGDVFSKFNGSVDEIMIFSSALNVTQISQIFQNQSSRFKNPGTQTFTNVNFRGNNTVNVSIAGNETTLNSFLQLQINNGSIVNFTNGRVLVYNITGNTTNANVTIIYQASPNSFYTPIVAGNITLQDYTVTAANNAPQITNVLFSDPVSPTEDSYTPTVINFTAYDADGASTFSTAKINVTRSTEPVRQNSSCIQLNTFGTNYANYSCTVQMWYFDEAGSWNITVAINDTTSLDAENSSNSFTYSLLTSFKLSPSAITFPEIKPGALNTTSSNDPLLMNNTGNKAIAAGSIDLNATHLVGETDNTKALYAGNFTISLAANGGIECGGTTTNVTTLARAVYTAITNSTLSRVNHSVNDGITGQEQLYSCLTLAGSELSSQSYSTSAQGAWTLRIALALFVIHRIKKKGKPKVEIIEREKERVPVTIFTNEVGGLEALCKYLKENRNMKYCEIARMLQRSDRTIWTAYKKAVEKYPVKMSEESSVSVPLNIFKDRNMTILESVIIYLREMNLKYSEIARLLERDQRNVRTIYMNASSKKHYKMQKEVSVPRSESSIPATIFTNEVGGLEALCKYLKENRNMKYCEIARMLQRSDRTIWTAYKKAVEKYNVKIHENYNDIYIPYEKLRDRTFTILESVIIYLREMNLKYSEIARLLERDQRNVRTIHARAVRKMSE